MANSNGLTEIDGNYKTQARLVASNVEENSMVFINGVAYTIDATDNGGGILLNNGLYANPSNIDDSKQNKSFTPISTVTALTIGGKYLSTVTNTHTLADGVTVGDSVVFSWAAGTIGTITGVSAIVFTDKDDLLHSDVTWVFDYPIVNVVLIWNGTNWEIQ